MRSHQIRMTFSGRKGRFTAMRLREPLSVLKGYRYSSSPQRFSRTDRFRSFQTPITIRGVAGAPMAATLLTSTMRRVEGWRNACIS